MDIPITIKDLLMFLIFCLLITAGVFFIAMIYNLTQLIKRVSGVIEGHGENINKTLGMLPEVTKNVNEVALSLKGNMETVGETINGFQEAVSETAAAVNSSTENILDFVKVIANVFEIVMKAFSSGRK